MIRLASVTPKQPSDILVTVEGSLPRRACHAHSATMNGREGEDHERVEGLEPGGRDLSAPDDEIDRTVGIVVGPQRNGVALCS